jgi:glycosyltransferase involved in cell wall biosynthesis
VSKYHGFFDLVEAFRIAKRSYKDLNLLLIVPSLQQLAKLGRFLPEETVVLENVPRRILPCVLRRASVLVLPHRAGTQFDYLPSNKVYDYMLAGRPIVAYRTPAVETALGDYSMRILVEPNNPVELAKGILKAMLLYGDSEPKPAFDKVPLLESAANALERVYHIVTK